jgi:glycogen(starch) synthase
MIDTQRTRVLMLGWEYPPHISGGLGTACEGLTRALAPLGVEIDFIVPTLYGVEDAPHMRLGSADAPLGLARASGDALRLREMASAERTLIAGDLPEDVRQKLGELEASGGAKRRVVGGVEVVSIPSMISPYMSTTDYDSWLRVMDVADSIDSVAQRQRLRALGVEDEEALPPASGGGNHYGRDLYSEVGRYAARVARLAKQAHADVVHAHDWMTFPAATRVARQLDIPLIVHVHSLEQDRAGDGANPSIVAIEGQGVRSATRVIAVSHYTARQIHRVHGVPLERIDVVHNGVYAGRTVTAYQTELPKKGPLVLFLGRITYQKGPEYFVEAAAKVLQKVPEARFIMAGSGDMLPRMKERVKELGIDASFDFPGFVRGADVEALFSTADAYVMPSVSEPFGIVALEAMSYETPVILSRQSGASEVLRHALKVDFWDVNKLAAQIVAVLSYPELKRSIVDMAREEVKRVHWEAAASKVKRVYQHVLGGN